MTDLDAPIAVALIGPEPMPPVDLVPYVDAVLRAIRESIDAGVLPATVASWHDLHGHLSADDLLIDADVPWPAGEYGYMDAVSDAVSVRLSRGEAAR